MCPCFAWAKLSEKWKCEEALTRVCTITTGSPHWLTEHQKWWMCTVARQYPPKQTSGYGLLEACSFSGFFPCQSYVGKCHACLDHHLFSKEKNCSAHQTLPYFLPPCNVELVWKALWPQASSITVHRSREWVQRGGMGNRKPIFLRVFSNLCPVLYVWWWVYLEKKKKTNDECCIPTQETWFCLSCVLYLFHIIYIIFPPALTACPDCMDSAIIRIILCGYIFFWCNL